MRKLSFFLVVCLIAGLFSGCDFTDDTITLNVYNWGEYISDGSDDLMDVNAEFERRYGVKINYKTYESNESMYTLLKSGAAEYDVVIPSDYMIGKMIDEGMLAKLNFDNIPNYQYIDEQYKNMEYDPNNEYSVPYTWGTVGIFYNSHYVSEEEVKAKGWDILWDEKYAGKIFMFDNARDSFMIALKKLGYSMNTIDPAHWQAAYDELAKQKPLVQGYFMDQVFQKMTNEEGWLAPYYSGDGANMITGEDGKEFIKYYIPDEGTNRFVDAMCVLKNSDKKELAEKYINFMCETEVAVANAEYICYASPNVQVFENEDYIAYMQEECHPDAISILYDFDMAKMEFYHDLPTETRNLMNSLWEELKIESTIGASVYIICAAILTVVLGLGIFNFVRKRIRASYYD